MNATTKIMVLAVCTIVILLSSEAVSQPHHSLAVIGADSGTSKPSSFVLLGEVKSQYYIGGEHVTYVEASVGSSVFYVSLGYSSSSSGEVASYRYSEVSWFMLLPIKISANARTLPAEESDRITMTANYAIVKGEMAWLALQGGVQRIHKVMRSEYNVRDSREETGISLMASKMISTHYADISVRESNLYALPLMVSANYKILKSFAIGVRVGSEIGGSGLFASFTLSVGKLP